MNQEVRVAHQTISDILMLQAQLESHMATQHEQLSEVYAEAIDIRDRVRRGNQNLSSARKHSREMTKCVIFVMLVLIFVLLFLDFYN